MGDECESCERTLAVSSPAPTLCQTCACAPETDDGHMRLAPDGPAVAACVVVGPALEFRAHGLDLDTEPDAAEREAREWWAVRDGWPLDATSVVASLAALLRAAYQRGRADALGESGMGDADCK